MKKNSLWKKLLRGICVAVFWLLIWEVVSLCVDSELILPSPLCTARTLVELASDGEFYRAAFFSLLRISVGFAAGVILGVVLGVLCAFSALADKAFSPLRSIIKSTPVSSFILLLLFWTGREYVPSFISMLIVLPVVHSGVYEGVKSTDPLIIEMANFYNVPMKRQLFTIYVESIKSRFVAASTTALGLAWKAGIAAEVLSTPTLAIGTKLYESKLYLETPQLFAWTALVIILSIVLEKIIIALLGIVKRNANR